MWCEPSATTRSETVKKAKRVGNHRHKHYLTWHECYRRLIEDRTGLLCLIKFYIVGTLDSSNLRVYTWHVITSLILLLWDDPVLVLFCCRLQQLFYHHPDPAETSSGHFLKHSTTWTISCVKMRQQQLEKKKPHMYLFQHKQKFMEECPRNVVFKHIQCSKSY